MLRQGVEYYEEGEIEGFPDLEMENIETFTDALTDQVETFMHEVEMEVEVLGRLEEVQDYDKDPKPEWVEGLQLEGNGSSMTAQGAAGGQMEAQTETSTESRRKSPHIVGKKNKRSSSMPSPNTKKASGR